MIELFFKLIRFCIVGFSGLGMDFLTTWVLKEKVKINQYVSNSFGFIIAVSSNYYFNRIWTFNSQNPNISTEYTNFIFVSIIGLALNNLLIFILQNKFQKKFYFAKIIAILITTLWNFLANNFYTFY
jgi:putative flippase GtrA